MSAPHNKIIATAAKVELAPLGFRRLGRSRLWLIDHGSWLNIVGFRPSQWSVAVDLDNAAHWVWAGAGFMSLDYFDRGSHTRFESEDQFAAAVARIAKEGASKALELERKFSSFDATAEFVIELARSSDRMRPSVFGYKAGLAAGLLGRMDEAAQFLRGLTDERVVSRAAPFLSVLDDPADFKAAVNEQVARQRATLKLPALERDAF